jgi:methionyl-tRNA synthetase
MHLGFKPAFIQELVMETDVVLYVFMASLSPEIKTSNHLFLDLPKLEERIKKFTDERDAMKTYNTTSVSITNSWMKAGLKPRCITRDLKWGTPVPHEDYNGKVFYVWFDAPIGYISITANYMKEWEL